MTRHAVLLECTAAEVYLEIQRLSHVNYVQHEHNRIKGRMMNKKR